MQCLAIAAAERLPPQQRLDPVRLAAIRERRDAYDLPRFLRQHVADEIVPRVMPAGRRSCGRCIKSAARFSPRGPRGLPDWSFRKHLPTGGLP